MVSINKIAVVTAVTNNYDYTVGHYGYHPQADYLFYTDGTAEPSDDRWQTRLIPPITDNLWKLAKLPKIFPHSIPELTQYDYLIWIDGSMQIKTEMFVPEILSYLNRGLLLSPHFDGRDCGYGEAMIRPPKYADEPFDAQCEFYRQEGFPEHYGLWEAGVQARKMGTPGLAEFEKVWMQQILDWSVQDQVSLGYSLWKTGFVPDVLPRSWREYRWIHLNAHLPKEEKETGE